MLRNLNYRENEILCRLKREIEINLRALSNTKLDQVEIRILSIILRDFWVIENKILEESGNGESDEHYLIDLRNNEKESIYDLMYALEESEKYTRPTLEIGLGESELVRELLSSHFRQIRDYENQVDEDLEAEDK